MRVEKPIIWDMTSKMYRSKQNEKNLVWDKIGDELGTSAEEAKKSFDSLRAKYREEIKRTKNQGRSGSGYTFREKFPYYNDRSFLKNIIKGRQTKTNIPSRHPMQIKIERINGDNDVHQITSDIEPIMNSGDFLAEYLDDPTNPFTQSTSAVTPNLVAQSTHNSQDPIIQDLITQDPITQDPITPFPSHRFTQNPVTSSSAHPILDHVENKTEDVVVKKDDLEIGCIITINLI